MFASARDFRLNQEFGALATSPASAEADATLGPTFKKAYAKIFDNVLVVCRACLLKFVFGDAKQDAPLALRAAVEFFGKVNEWHQEPWATSSHKDQYIVLAKLLTGVPKLNKETNAEEVVSFIHDINNIAEMDVDTFLSVLPPGDDADSEAAAIRSFIFQQCYSQASTSNVQQVSETIATHTDSIKAKFSGIEFSKFEFHTPATDDAILGKLVDLKCVDLKTFAEITGLGTKIVDSALVAQSMCLEASAQFRSERGLVAVRRCLRRRPRRPGQAGHRRG